MQSTNSYFNPTLYKKQIIRFWPLWGAYGLIMVMLMPLYYLMNLGKSSEFPQDFAASQVLSMATAVAPWIAAFAGILGAMAVWSYLYNSRSVGMLHALPMRREGLFLTNYLAGLSFLILPTLGIFVLTLGAEAIGGVVNVRNLAIWLMIQCLTYLFFFSFATLIAFVTGALLALPALYLILNGLAAGLVMLLNNTFSCFVYGFGSAQPLNDVGFWLTPLYVFSRKLDFTSYVYDEALEKTVPLDPAQVTGLSVVIGAAVIGLVMAGLALALYRRRKLEMAGEVVAVSWMRPVFKYGVALCGGLTFGNAFYAIFAESLPDGIGTMLFFLLLWGAVFYFAAEMLLQKSFRIFGKSWRGCVTLVCVMIACVLVMELDVTGYERSIPAVGEVKSVRVNNAYLYGNVVQMPEEIASDPDYIAQVIDLHTALVNGKREVETRLAQEDGEPYYKEGRYIQQQNTQYLDLEYTMQDGSLRTRLYHIPVTALLLEDPASPAAKYDDLVNNVAWRAASILPKQYQRKDLVGGYVNVKKVTRDAGVEGSTESVYRPRELSKEEAQLLYDAVKADLTAGRLGRVWSLWDETYYETEYINDMGLYFYGPYGLDENHKTYNTTQQIGVTLQSTATSTLAALKQLGLEDGVDLRTVADENRMERANGSYSGDVGSHTNVIEQEIAAEYVS